MPSITLSKEVMVDELGLPSEAISDEVTDTGRWSIYHDIIFEYEGKFYQTDYSEGATEQQCESPWEDETEITSFEVEKKEVLVESWVRVK